MKKFIVFVGIIGMFAVSSCSFKTCPTYTKKNVEPVTQTSQERV
ncbi:MAG: hypothetical protein WBB45_08465 [Cyclobacteriaceae bacterium]